MTCWPPAPSTVTPANGVEAAPATVPPATPPAPAKQNDNILALYSFLSYVDSMYMQTRFGRMRGGT